MDTTKETLQQKLYERAIAVTNDDVFYKRQLHNKLTEIRINLERDQTMEELPYTKRLIELVDGWDYSTLVHIEGHLDVLMLTAKKDKQFPAHSHAKKQIIYVLDGVVSYTVNGEVVTLSPGDKLTIPPNTVHSAYPEIASRVLSIFLPPITIKLSELNE